GEEAEHPFRVPRSDENVEVPGRAIQARVPLHGVASAHEERDSRLGQDLERLGKEGLGCRAQFLLRVHAAFPRALFPEAADAGTQTRPTTSDCRDRGHTSWPT